MKSDIVQKLVVRGYKTTVVMKRRQQTPYK